MMLFRLPTRTPKIAKLPKSNIKLIRPAAEPIGLIQGKRPQSREEWRAAVSLWKLKIRFDYQVWINGGNLIRGGQILDYLLYIPFPVPLQILGEYWHSGLLGAEDEFKLNVLRQYFGVEPLVAYGSQMQTQEQSDETIRKLVGR